VLDPFVGTGTTTVAAINAGRSSIGIDIDPTFIGLAKERLQRTALSQQLPHLFEVELDVQFP